MDMGFLILANHDSVLRYRRERFPRPSMLTRFHCMRYVVWSRVWLRKQNLQKFALRSWKLRMQHSVRRMPSFVWKTPSLKLRTNSFAMKLRG